MLGVYDHGGHIPFDALLKFALPVALAVGTAAVSDDAVRTEEVALTIFSRVESVLALRVFSDDALSSALDVPLGSEGSRVDSVSLAPADAVVVEAALGKIS